MDLTRLRLGEWIAGVAGVVLFVSLFTTWYGASVEVGRTSLQLTAGFNAWESFDLLDIVLALIALVAVALAVLQATQTLQAIPVGAGVLTVIAGVLGVLLVAYRLIDQPGPNEFVEVRRGAWLGLFATIAITLGGWESIRDERARGLPPGPDPQRRPAP
jgi:hypothetical protein